MADKTVVSLRSYESDEGRNYYKALRSNINKIILWSLLLTAAASAHKVVESTEDIGPEAFTNITTLYPVANQNTNNNTHNDNTNRNGTQNEDNIEKKEEKPKKEATSWKIEAAYAESNLDKDNATTAVPVVGEKNETKEFRPSQHLGSFLDDDVAPAKETFDLFTPDIKKPASGFVSSKEVYQNKIPKQLLHTHKEYPYKIESSIFTRAKDSWKPDRHKPWPTGTPGLEGSGDRPGKGWGLSSGIDSLERPGKGNQGNLGFGGFGERPGKIWAGNFKFDATGDRPKGWALDSLEPKPTMETPVKLPAGGLYKYTDPFKEKPGNHDEDFGLEFNNDAKENSVKKRGNPWQGIMRMLTAFIPLGLIVAALTPSIITIENTAPDNTYPSNIYRRTEAGTAELPTISERCRRRLLCELYNEKNYSPAQSSKQNSRKWKQCYRIHCEDTAALTETLGWLLQRQYNKK